MCTTTYYDSLGHGAVTVSQKMLKAQELSKGLPNDSNSNCLQCQHPLFFTRLTRMPRYFRGSETSRFAGTDKRNSSYIELATENYSSGIST